MDLKWLEKLLPKNLLGEFYEIILPGLTFWFWLQFKQGVLLQTVNLEEILKVSFISLLIGNVIMPLCDNIYQQLGEFFSKNLAEEGQNISSLQQFKIQEFYQDSNSNLKNNYNRSRSKIIGSILLTLYLTASVIYMSIFNGIGVYQIGESIAIISIFIFGVILPTRKWIESAESYIVNKTYFDEKAKREVK